ncbi:MAG: META domain-containing protein [Anaerolineales bacterium]|nr:META domain-containing protein [Anaerolineales bacterium]
MTPKRILNLIMLLLAGLLLIGCTAAGGNEPAANDTPADTTTGSQPTTDEPAGLANPASVYCEAQGGTLAMRTDESGGQYGVCIFEDGSECDEWAFFRGECAPENTQLFDTLWLLQSMAGEAPLPNTDPTLRLTADYQLSGSTGCNSFFASVTVEDGAWSVGEMGSTLIGCMDDLMAQETAVLAHLQSATGHTLAANQLTIHTPDGDLVYAPAPDASLEDTRWTLSGLVEKEAVVSTWVDAEVFLQFVDGQVSGSAGCNRLSGTYTVDGRTLTLSPLGMTRMACEEERTAREAEVAEMLTQVAGFAIEWQTLTLLDADGNSLAMFMADGPAGE